MNYLKQGGSFILVGNRMLLRSCTGIQYTATVDNLASSIQIYSVGDFPTARVQVHLCLFFKAL